MRRHSVATPTETSRTDVRTASWPLYVNGTMLTVRSSSRRDLPAVAMMHSRCSAKSLLDRYRLGGRAPAVVSLDQHLREPLGYVVMGEDGRIIATATVSPDPAHPDGCGELGILVEDDWQRFGVGRPLLRHLAAVAALSGYHQLIVYPGTAAIVVQRLMIGIGATRMTLDANDRHLHTSLHQGTALGLGPMQADVAQASTPELAIW